MRYKEQTLTKLEALNNFLYSIIKGLDTQSLTAPQVAALIEDARARVNTITAAVELESNP
jgi:hypothetical protein